MQAIVEGVLASLAPPTPRAEIAGAAGASSTTLDREIAHLAEAIAQGGQLPPLLDGAQDAAGAARRHSRPTIAAHEAVDGRALDRATMSATVRQRVDGWQALLTGDGRADRVRLLREILAGPLHVDADGRAYRFEGELSVGQLLAGEIGLPTFVARPAGLEPAAPGLEGRCSIQLSYGRVAPMVRRTPHP